MATPIAPRGEDASFSMPMLDLLVLSDLHYAGPGTPVVRDLKRRIDLGLELAVRAIRDALRFDKPDAILLLGDIVERGSDPNALDDMRDVSATLAKFGIPILTVPGNHDTYPDDVARIFHCPRGLHQLGAYDCMIFHDQYDDNEVCTRPAEQRSLLQRRAPDRPMLALQHNPILPRINSAYPYTITDAEAIAEEYHAARVFLSISGHYHAGLPPFTDRDTTYVVCPALCEYPYRYTRLRIEGRRVASIRQFDLAPPELSELFDTHIHTQFAYCATDISIVQALERATAFKLGMVGLCEHADQLYFPRENIWNRTDVNEIAAMRKAVAQGHSRHKHYRQVVQALTRRSIRLGLEVEHEESGRRVAILEEDLIGYDYLIGSIHYVTKDADTSLSQHEAEREFLRRTTQLVCSGISVLGHPFRYFRRHNRPVPVHLFAPVASLLAEHGVAAEINFHGDEPCPEFLAMCLSRRVRLAIGTDAHSLVEVCELLPHLDLLRALGVWDRRDLVLWRPTGASSGGKSPPDNAPTCCPNERGPMPTPRIG